MATIWSRHSVVAVVLDAPYTSILLRPVAVKCALANLIENAVKHGGGACVTLDEGPGAVTVRVEDDGPGISEADLKVLFEPVRPLDASHERACQEEQKLSRAVEAPAAPSASNMNTVFPGLMKIEALNRLEQATFAERLPEAFLRPSPELVAASKSLSLPFLRHATTG